MNNIINMIHLLQQEFGKHKIELKSQHCYEFNIGTVVYYLLYNKNNKVLEITYSDKTKLTTKEKYIFSKSKPINAYSLNLGFIDGVAALIQNSYDIYHVIKLPELVNNEINSSHRTHLLTGYLFAYPLRNDLAEVVTITKVNNNLKVEYNGESILTILNAEYNVKNNEFYCDSWSYIERSISRIERKVVTQHMRLTQSIREDASSKIRDISQKLLEKINLDNKDKIEYLLDNLNRDIDSIGE